MLYIIQNQMHAICQMNEHFTPCRITFISNTTHKHNIKLMQCLHIHGSDTDTIKLLSVTDNRQIHKTDVADIGRNTDKTWTARMQS